MINYLIALYKIDTRVPVLKINSFYLFRVCLSDKKMSAGWGRRGVSPVRELLDGLSWVGKCDTVANACGK